MRIVLDPGHGGIDPGAISHPLIEADLNIELALIVFATLQSSGHDVLLTRTIDETVDLGDRADFANEHKADLFISLHHNSYHKSSAKGFEVLYRAAGKSLAGNICKGLAWPIRKRGAKLRRNLYVLNHTEMPAILIEAGFISSDIDREDTLLDAHYPEQKRWVFYCAIADAIKQSILGG